MPVDYSRWKSIQKELLDEEDDLETESARNASQSAEAEQAERLRREAEVQHEETVKAAGAANYGWMHDVDPDSYEDFTIKRTARVVKPRGTERFKAGDYKAAEELWLGGLSLVRRVGLGAPGAKQLYMQLKCNLAKLYIETDRCLEARQVCTAVLDMDPGWEKAWYRRAEASLREADLPAAKRDLHELLRIAPQNLEAAKKLSEIKAAYRESNEQQWLKSGPGGLNFSAKAAEELTADGTLRKLRILTPGQSHPDEVQWTWPWGLDEWLGDSSKKAVLTVHVVIRTVGGEELFTTRTRQRLPETPMERDELRAAMQEVAVLDDMAGKQPRRLDDFLHTEEMQPLRWRYGDPSVYAGFELAARTMMLGECALFEIDQPLLEPSVASFYKSRGGVARVAGLPDFQHHIEARKLHLLAEELPEWELDLENKAHRTVRAELELVSLDLYTDISPQLTGEMLVYVSNPGREDGLLLESGDVVLGAFSVAGALSGQELYAASQVEWVLGRDDVGKYCKMRYGDDVFVPRCVGQILRAVSGEGLREGVRVNARMQEGPTPFELNPNMASDYSWQRAMEHRPPASITVEVKQVLSGGSLTS